MKEHKIAIREAATALIAALEAARDISPNVFVTSILNGEIGRNCNLIDSLDLGLLDPPTGLLSGDAASGNRGDDYPWN